MATTTPTADLNSSQASSGGRKELDQELEGNVLASLNYEQVLNLILHNLPSEKVEPLPLSSCRPITKRYAGSPIHFPLSMLEARLYSSIPGSSPFCPLAFRGRSRKVLPSRRLAQSYRNLALYRPTCTSTIAEHTREEFAG
jgi:hypothetical protein